MAQANFVKTALPQALLDVRRDGFDFRPFFEKYQMVPRGGTRPWKIEVKSGPVRIASGDTNIAEIAPDASSPKQRVMTFRQSGTFVIAGGAKTGRTFIVAEDDSGSRIDYLAVSNKPPKPLKYNLVLLKDSVNVSPSISPANAAKEMNFVEVLYLNQCNVLMQKQQSGELSIKRNLSDANGVLQLGELFDNKEDIIFQAIIKNGLGVGVDVVYVFTWSLEGGNLPFSTTGNKLNGRTETAASNRRTGPTIIYINCFSPNLSLTIAHETGHHFGLSHWSLFRPTDFMMEAGGTGGVKGFGMTQDDIDSVNP